MAFRWILVFIAVICSLSVQGCWGRKFFRAPGQTIETSAKVDSLLKENMILQRRIYNLERMMVREQEYSRGQNAQMKMDLEEIKDQINALSQILGESGSNEGNVRQHPAAHSGSSPDAGAVSPGIPAAGSPGETVSAPDSAVSPGSGYIPSPEEIHRQAYLDFSRMEYQIALEESQTFLNTYPEHPLSQEVRFIRGECFMELGQYFDALKEFSSILRDYPRGKKAAPALLRMAVSYEKIGDSDLAAGVVRRLVREYPESDEAAEARERYSGMLEE